MKKKTTHEKEINHKVRNQPIKKEINPQKGNNLQKELT
jgi:hypothetical protein